MASKTEPGCSTVVNQEELAICKRRGHEVRLLYSGCGWEQCSACGMWLREMRNLEESEDSGRERPKGFPQRTDQNELAICKKRGHKFGLPYTPLRWECCSECGVWVREVRTIEEREDAPPKEEWNPLWKLHEDMKAENAAKKAGSA